MNSSAGHHHHHHHSHQEEHFQQSETVKDIVPKDSYKQFRFPSGGVENDSLSIEYVELNQFDRTMFWLQKRSALITLLMQVKTIIATQNKEIITIKAI